MAEVEEEALQPIIDAVGSSSSSSFCFFIRFIFIDRLQPLWLKRIPNSSSSFFSRFLLNQHIVIIVIIRVIVSVITVIIVFVIVTVIIFLSFFIP